VHRLQQAINRPMIIKNSQISIFGQKKYQIFIDKMVEFVNGNFKISGKPEDIKMDVASYIEESEKYGFDEEVTIEQYIFLKWEYPEFRKYPLSKEILDILCYPDRNAAKIIDELICHFEALKTK
jgi:hypothetical protein